MPALRYLPVILAATCLGGLSASPAAAQVEANITPAHCDQLWYLRNLIMDRAGYCFQSRLGVVIFDNAGCSGTEIQLSAAQQEQLDRLAGLESALSCKVDTDASSVNIWDADFLAALRDLPIADGTESSCLGWTGPRTPVFDGYSEGSRVIGFINPGDDVHSGFLAVGEWKPVTIYRDNDLEDRLIAWLHAGPGDWSAQCSAFAG